MRRLLAAAISIIIVTVGVALASTSGDPSRPAPKPASLEWSPGSAADPALAQAAVAEAGQRVGAYIVAVERDQLGAFLASIPPPAPSGVVEPALSPAPAPEVNTSSGPHSDAWWRGVSVCEQGGRNDPFFGYFSIMDGSAGGLDWSTQVAMANGIISRYGDSAWAASCVAAGYGASPGG